MILRTLPLVFLVSLFGCTPELDEEPRCRLTSDGWLCDDGASPPDATSDVGVVDDMETSQPDAAVEDDMGVSPVDMGDEPPATSCVELRDRGDTGRGLRTIELAGQELEVFCDQDLAGGGWMLVGRSVAGATGDFGWNTARGSVENDAEPYSMGRTDITVNELLIGDRGDSKTWGDRIYRVDLPDDFLNSCVASSCQTTVSTVTGACDNPTMFNFAGHVQRTDSFWMRDVAEEVVYGLLPDGWSVFYEDCTGGELEARQGMLFVR